MGGSADFKSIFEPYFRPRDPSWNGPQGALLKLILVKNVVFFTYFGFGLVYLVWLSQTITLGGAGIAQRLWFYIRLSFNLGMMIELAHTVIVSTLVRLNKFHVVTALASSTAMSGMWIFQTFEMAVFIARPSSDNKVNYLGIGVVAVVGMIPILYLVMMVLASIGVSKYLKTRKQSRRIQL